MKNKFEVRLVIEQSWSEDYGERITLIDILISKLCISCPHCHTYSVPRIDSEVRRFDTSNGIAIDILTSEEDNRRLYDLACWPRFDFICSCPSCDKTAFINAEASSIVSDTSDFSLSQRKLDGEILQIFPFREGYETSDKVPKEYLEEFIEASLTLKASPKASAALSRRILQRILQNEFGIKRKNLFLEMEDFIERPGIPTYILDAIDAVRHIGNFAAHPSEEKDTGKIVDVEPGEAEWLLEIIISLFDFTFVQPKRLEERRQQLNQKLESLGKPPMKSSRRDMG